MNQKQLIDAVSSVSADTKVTVARVIGSLVDVIQNELKKGGDVTIAGLGKFSTRDAAARTVKSPNGEAVAVAAKVKPKFSAAAQLKRAAEGV